MPHPRLATPRPRTMLAAVAAAVLLGAASPAAAAPPPNDTPETATDLTTFPFTQDVSIAEAGTEPFDTGALSRQCDRDPVEGTVWYRFEATEEMVFTFEATTQDGFVPGVALIRELPATRKSIALCGQEIITGTVDAGDTFWLAAFSRTADATGTMTVSMEARPVDLEFSVDSITADAETGTVTATGTYRCTLTEFEFGVIGIWLDRDTRRGEFGEIDVTGCSGATEPFTVEVTSSRGRLTGPVDVSVSAFVCDDVGCDQREVSTRLKP